MTRVVAWDIETCPYPIETFTDAQQDRYEKELALKRERQPEMDEADASRLVRSVHPMLGWICCIAAVSGTMEEGPNDPVTWTAMTPKEEPALLKAFWEAVEGFPDGTRWVTFNGKRFDVPFLEARSAAHGLAPTREDLRNTYPYDHKPHTDLTWLWPHHYAFEDLCELLGVASPKTGGNDGGCVAEWVARGEVDRLTSYAKRDALATWACCRAASNLVGLGRQGISREKVLQ
jgi:hypothetical protein